MRAHIGFPKGCCTLQVARDNGPWRLRAAPLSPTARSRAPRNASICAICAMGAGGVNQRSRARVYRPMNHPPTIRLAAAVFGACSFMACFVADPFDPIALGSGATSPLGAKVERAEACDASMQYAKAACERAEKCGQQWWMFGWDRTVCEHHVTASLEPFVALGWGYGSDKNAVRECATKLREAQCGYAAECELFGGEGWGQKRRERGVECSGEYDCKAGLTCLNRVCTDRLRDGGVCDRSEQCASGLSCQERACRKVEANATSCHGEDDPCHSERVDASYGPLLYWQDAGKLACDAATLKCKAVTRSAKVGQPCGKMALCEDGAYCRGLLSPVGQAKCAPVAKFGEACDEGSCMTCSDGICKDPLDGVCN